MREMLAARDDRDFVLAGPRAALARARPVRRDVNPMQVRRPARRGRVAGGIAAFAAVAGALRHRFGVMAGIGLATAAGVAVCVNALSLQTGRHPAPIFAPTEPVRPSARLQRPVEVKPVVPTGPVQAAAPAVSAAPVAAPPAPGAQTGSIAPLPPRRAEAPAAKAAPRDAIGDMIRATDPAAPATKADRSVAFAQRALSKLGPTQLKADGVMGAGTRAAIERFEREHKLPVTGEASGRTLRELANRSGLAPD